MKTQVDMHAHTKNGDRAARLVVAGIGDELNVGPKRKTPRQSEVVIAFEDLFPPIGQPAVAQHKAKASIGEIFLVQCGNSVGNEDRASVVLRTAPEFAGNLNSSFEGVVDFREGVAREFPVVPADARKCAKTIRQSLLPIESETILMRAHLAYRFDIGHGGQVSSPCGQGIGKTPHGRLVDKAKHADLAIR